MVLSGTDINQGTKVDSVDDCQGLCKENSICKAFTFEISGEESTCWLKREIGSLKSKQSAISGPKYCRKYKEEGYILG